MTLITFQDGKAVMRDGKVGTAQECCCGPIECSCEQVDISGCPDSFEVTFEGVGAFDPACTKTFTYTIAKNDLNADNVDDGWQGGVTNFHSVMLSCANGRWILSIGADNYPFDCPVVQLASVDLGSVCECPQTGTFSVPGIFGDQTTVAIG